MNQYFQRKTRWIFYRRVRPIAFVIGSIFLGFSAEAMWALEPEELPPAERAAEAEEAPNDETEGQAATIEETPVEEIEAEELPAPVGGAGEPSHPEAWRYRWRNGHWWYWLKSKRWAWWDGAAWRDYTAADYARWRQELRSAGPLAVAPPLLAPLPDVVPVYRYPIRGRFFLRRSRVWIIAPDYYLPAPPMRSDADGVFGSGRGVSGPGGGFDPPTSSGIGVY